MRDSTVSIKEKQLTGGKPANLDTLASTSCRATNDAKRCATARIATNDRGESNDSNAINGSSLKLARLAGCDAFVAVDAVACDVVFDGPRVCVMVCVCVCDGVCVCVCV